MEAPGRRARISKAAPKPAGPRAHDDDVVVFHGGDEYYLIKALAVASSLPGRSRIPGNWAFRPRLEEFSLHWGPKPEYSYAEANNGSSTPRARSIRHDDRLPFPIPAPSASAWPGFSSGLERRAIRSEEAGLLSRLFGKLFAILYIVGIGTGFVMTLQFGTNWGRFSNFVNGIFGPILEGRGPHSLLPRVHFLRDLDVRAGARSRKACAVSPSSWSRWAPPSPPSGSPPRIPGCRPRPAMPFPPTAAGPSSSISGRPSSIPRPYRVSSM